MNNFAHANATADDIALELFNPYPVGISDFNEILIFVLSRSFFGTIFSTTLFINRELRFFVSDSIMIPFPCNVSTSVSTLGDMPSVAPFPVAIALTMEIAPCRLAFAIGIKILQAMLFSWCRMVPQCHAIFQMSE